ncbi:MAG: M42 family peptidase [Caldilineae bacterium]|nr:MAG: M42 family peptidase [Caldilineae bacterium]
MQTAPKMKRAHRRGRLWHSPDTSPTMRLRRHPRPTTARRSCGCSIAQATPMRIKDTLKQLSETDGPTGSEQGIAQAIYRLLEPLCDQVSIDGHFNVIGIRQGEGGEPRPRLAVMAHMDEIFLMISAVEGPFLRFRPYACDPRVLIGQEVVVLGRRRIRGVIGDRPPHLMSAQERRQMPEPTALVIDTGLDADSLAQLVRVGDYALVARTMVELLNERVAGKAFDNRASVVALLAALEELQKARHPCDVLAVANVGEEFSGVGARGIMDRLRPDLVLVLDVTFGQQPGTPKAYGFKLAGGPVVGIGPNIHPRLTESLVELCDSLEIPYALEPMPRHSGTDAVDTQVASGGAPTAVIGIPTRNLHSPVETLALKDVRRVARLVAAFAGRVDTAFLEGLRFKLPEEVQPS